MVIWKWEIEVIDRQHVIMPAGAKLLDVQMQAGVWCIWALCDPSAPNEVRNFAIYGTGNPIPNDPGEYVGTIQMYGGGLVFHLFEIILKGLNTDNQSAEKTCTQQSAALNMTDGVSLGLCQA